MAYKKDVLYFAAKYTKDSWFFFHSHDYEYTIRLAWWNKEKMNFFLDALIDLYGAEQWPEIYQKCLAWFVHIEEKNKHLFNKPAASLVIYKKNNSSSL